MQGHPPTPVVENSTQIRYWSDAPHRLLRNLFGNRHRATVNTFTQMRYCNVSSRIDIESKGISGTQKPCMYP